LAVSWSDGDDSKDEGKTESTNHVSALTGRIMSDTKSYKEEMSYDELAMAYYEFISRNGELTQRVERQEDMITQLQEERNENLAQISDLSEEVTKLNSQLKHEKKQTGMMTSGTKVMDEILKEETKIGGFSYKALNRKQRNRNSAYALEDCGLVRKQQYNQQIEAGEETDDSTKNKTMLKYSEEHLSFKTKKKSSLWVYDHCKGKGHIRPYCVKLHGQSKNPYKNPSKKKWIPRSVISGLIAHTSLRASFKEDWYFDSGCSRYMTGVDKYLENVRPHTSSYVTFGDGAK